MLGKIVRVALKNSGRSDSGVSEFLIRIPSRRIFLKMLINSLMSSKMDFKAIELQIM